MASAFGIPRKKSYRASMSIDILLLMLITTSMFDLVPFQTIFSGNNTFTYYVLMMAYIYLRYMGFTFREGILKHMMPLLLILISIFLSFIPAYVFYGQHLYHSLIVYRRVLCFFPSFCPSNRHYVNVVPRFMLSHSFMPRLVFLGPIFIQVGFRSSQEWSM